MIYTPGVNLKVFGVNVFTLFNVMQDLSYQNSGFCGLGTS
jgi:hypothetical protein